MTYHILNGDCLAEKFPRNEIPGELIICRECLIEGPVNAVAVEDLFDIRASFIKQTYSESNYVSKVKSEFDKILNLPPGAEVALWFENDLFCQVNMWFVISLMKKNTAELNLFRAFPEIKNPEYNWKGFGISGKEDLIRSFSNKVKFTNEDIELGNDLWTTYSKDDLHKLAELSESKSNCFQFLEEV